MKTNLASKSEPIYTHEGARAVKIDAERQLRRSVMACMLFEDTFYEDGTSIAERIAALIPQCRPEYVAACAFEARTRMKLRHVPLLLCREMLKHSAHKKLIGKLLADVIQRPDEITEFLSLYWQQGKRPLAAQVKKALARAFNTFGEYAFAKYDRDEKVKLRDALFLCHAKPQTPEQEILFKKIVDRTLTVPDTWEVALSGGADKRETFERLMAENKLGALAFIRNLRNMKEAGVPVEAVSAYATLVNVERVLPFRFIAAARACPGWEHVVEPLMLKCLEAQPKLAGKTAIVVDNSGSMYGAKVSARSDVDRSDAACALAILVREICAQCVVIGFATSAAVIPARRGFALVDAIKGGPSGGTMTDTALALAEREGYDRIIVITDEQSHQCVRAPRGIGYFINVATNKNGIGYGPWTHIDGWSEAVIDYIREVETAIGD
jgi:hypothetical protein